MEGAASFPGQSSNNFNQQGENKMKKLSLLTGLLWLFVLCGAAFGADLAFHGDLNNRFLTYTNHNDWLSPESKGVLHDDTVQESYGELKYRFWFEAGTDDNAVKGVYAIEIGGIRFGRNDSSVGKGQGGSFSGDAVNVETRWAYLDFQVPFVEQKSRFKVGLQPTSVNSFLWQETAAGVKLDGSLNVLDYELGWIRAVDNLARSENDDDIKDQDSFIGRLNYKASNHFKIGLFGLFMNGDAGQRPDFSTDAAGNPTGIAPGLGLVTPRKYEIKSFADIAGLSFYTVGVDGSYTAGRFFVDWDLMYEGGTVNDIFFDDSEFSGKSASGDFDVSAYLAHVDLGYKMGKTKFTYTFWYASGDDNAADNDFDGFLSVDVDRFDSQTMFEGNYTDDVTYFTERPYMLDKGFIMNKLAVDYQATAKLKVGSALMYMATAEDIDYFDSSNIARSNSDIGLEINGYLKYMLYKRLEFAINAGYLFSGDAMDAFEQGAIKNGSADEDIFVSSARLRYKF